MKKFILYAASSVALFSAPAVAQSYDDSGWYLRGNAGYGTHTDAEFDNSVFRGDVESEGNVAGSLGIGYEFEDNWRVELDGDTLWTDLGAIGQQPSSFAKLRTNSLMLNAIYDFEDFDRFEPYIGAGVGLVQGQLRAEAHDFQTTNTGGTFAVANPACLGGQNGACSIDDKDMTFGWQLLAGLGYAISDNLTWDTHYSYMNVDSGDLDFDGNFTPNFLSALSVIPATFPHDTELQDVGAHTLMTGLRYRFGAKAPKIMATCWDGSSVEMLSDCPARPPAMKTCWNGSEVLASAVCPERPVVIETQTCWDGSTIPLTSTCPAQRETFLCWDNTVVYDSQSNCPPEVITRSGEDVVTLCGNQYRQEIIYYEFDKGQSAETRNTINRILDIGEFCQVNNIRVVGHTDRSGSAAYNLALSKRRAKDARDELVRQGINSAVITSEGKGETENFVPTADGVKEQLNRRTEVLIQLNDTGIITN